MSPSSLGRLSLCPPSFWLTQKARDIGLSFEAGEAADRGTLCHRYTNPREPIPPGVLSPEETEWVLAARRYVEAHTAGASCTSYEARRELEHKGAILTFGTLDVEAIYSAAPLPGHVKVIDLKFGQAELHEELIQWQLRAYAAMALQAEPEATEARVYVYHVPKRVEWEGSIRRADLPTVVEAIARIVQAVHASKDVAPSPHPAACHYCPARTICPALQNEVKELMALGESQLVPQIRKALDFCQVLSGWISAVREKAKAMLEEGQTIPGWSLGVRRVRKITDIMGVRDAVYGVVDEVALLEAMEIGITKLEGLYVAASKKGPREAKAELDAKLREFNALTTVEQKILKKEGQDGAE